MSERPLLLSPAKIAVLADARRYERLRLVAACVGVFVVLVGAANLMARAVSLADIPGGMLAIGPEAALSVPTIVAATSTAGLIPARLKIPSIGVDAAIEQVGVKTDGSMDTPKKFGDLGWYAPGSRPGMPGHAVFAGHVDNALTTAGVFEHLSQVSLGDYVAVSDSAGKTLLYKVTSVQSYPADAPTSGVFASSGPSQLVLITCTGDWVPGQKQFDQRLVVLATPAQ